MNLTVKYHPEELGTVFYIAINAFGPKPIIHSPGAFYEHGHKDF